MSRELTPAQEEHVETIVAWLVGVQPKMRDEPAAFKAACIRAGARAAMMAGAPEGEQ